MEDKETEIIEEKIEEKVEVKEKDYFTKEEVKKLIQENTLNIYEKFLTKEKEPQKVEVVEKPKKDWRF
ncbi:MAG: hypothetical protein ACRC4M_01220 [Mycoplasma sp.]